MKKTTLLLALTALVCNLNATRRAYLWAAMGGIGGKRDDATAKLLEAVLAYPGVPARLLKPRLEVPLVPVIPVCFRKGEDTFAYFSTVTTLGTPQDITLQEMRIESFFPMDRDTTSVLRTWAVEARKPNA